MARGATRSDGRAAIQPPLLPLPPEEGQVRIILLEHTPSLDDEVLESLLPWTAEDRARMAAFRHRPSRCSWCVARLLARSLLSRLTGIPLDSLALEGQRGRKPRLPGSGISFNWSHAEGCVAFAYARDLELGVDLESWNRSLPDWEGLSRSSFSPLEAEWVEAGGSVEGPRRFLSLFVQKEASLKALGQGLSAPLTEAACALSLPPHAERGAILSLLGQGGRWLLAARALDAPPGLAFEIQSHRLET